jgi:SAM-dependent methyltransferase
MFVCPRCSTPLAASPDVSASMACTCGAAYPVFAGGVPVLVDDARALLGAARHRYAREAALLSGALHGFGELGKQGVRPEAMARLRAGVTLNRDALARWVAAIDVHTGGPIGPAPPEDRRTLKISGIFRHLVTDWGWRERSEAMIAATAAAVRRRLDGATERGLAVCLGAGAGRLAWELCADVEHVVSIDLEAAFGVTAGWLRAGDVTVCDPLEANARHVADLCPEVPLRMPAAPGFHPCVADAMRPPVGEGTASLVVSAFFSDVVAFPRLLALARRLLRPGGRFVHLGPLGYFAYEPAEMWTADEVREHVPSFGFRFDDEEWVAHPYWPNASIVEWQVQSWCWSATKT